MRREASSSSMATISPGRAARRYTAGMAGRARDDELAAAVEALRARVEALEAEADDDEDEVEWLTPWRGFLLGAGLGFLFG